jgi:hypothetical protein
MQTPYSYKHSPNGQTETVSFHADGRPYIRREKYYPGKNKRKIPGQSKDGPLAFMFEDKEIGMIGVILATLLILWLGLFLLPTLVLLLLPVRVVWVRAFRYAPKPPNNWFFFLLVCLLTVVPGLVGGLGIFMLWLMAVVRLFLHFGIFTSAIDLYSQDTPFQQLFDHFFKSVPIPEGLLRELAHDQPLLLAAGIVPTYVVTAFYLFFWIRTRDNQVIEDYYAGLEREELATQAAEARLEAHEEELRRLEALEVKSGRAIDLGEVLHRSWNLRTMRWTTGPAPRGNSQRCFLTLQHLMRHLIVIGPTRMGKTLNIILPLVRFCRKNRLGAIFFDPKGYEIPADEAALVFSLQPKERADSFRLCLIDMELDFTDRANNLAEALIDSDNSGDEAQYFISSGRLALSALLRSHYLVFGQYPELNEVLGYTSDATKLANVRAKLKLLTADSTKAPHLRRLAEEADGALAEVERRVESKADPLGTMYNALRPLAEGKYRDYLTTDPWQGLSIRQILQKRVVTRMALTSVEGDIGRAIGRVVIRQFTSAVLDPSADKSFSKLLVIDEAHNYICKALEIGVTQAAGNNVAYVLAFQSLEEIRNPALRSVIFGNCRNKIVLKGVEGPEDAGRFSRLFGQEDLPYLSTSKGHSEGQASGTNWSEERSRNSSYGSSFSGGGNSSRGYSYGGSLGESESRSTTSNTGEQISYQARLRWLPEEIGAIPYFHAIAYLDDGYTEPEPLLIKFTDPERRQAMEPVLPSLKEKVDPAFMVAFATSQVQPNQPQVKGNGTPPAPTTPIVTPVAALPAPAPTVQTKPKGVSFRPGVPALPHLLSMTEYRQAVLAVSKVSLPPAKPTISVKMTLPPEPSAQSPTKPPSKPVEKPNPDVKAALVEVPEEGVVPLPVLEPAPKTKPARSRGRPKKAKPEPSELPPTEPGEL